MDKKVEQCCKQMKEIFNKIDAISDVDALDQIAKYAENNYQRALGINTRKEITKFHIGQNVRLKSEALNRRGYKAQQLRGKIGKITKINQKTIKVSFDIGNWKIGPSFLEII